MEDEYKIKSKNSEQKFAMRHDIENIHNCIDLIGYTAKEAVELTQRRIQQT